MRILYFHNSIPEYRKELFLRLSERNKDLKFIFTIMGYSENVYNTKVKQSELDKLSYKILQKGYRCLKNVKNEIMEYKPEIIIVPALDTFRELIIAFTILFYCKKDTKLIYVWEKWAAPRKYITFRKYIKNGIQGVAARMIFRRVDLFLAPGEKTKEYFLSHGVRRDAIMIFHDVSTVEKCKTVSLREKYGIKDEQKIVLYYGRIIKRKGLDTLLEAVSIAQCRNEIFLIVAGDGEYREYCERYATRLKLDNVKFVGFVPPIYKYNYFSQSDIFVLPSVAFDGTIEAWGLTVNEAILTNNVVICSDVVGAAYELVNAENGFLFRQACASELAEALDKACKFEKTESFYQYTDKIMQEYSYENMCKDFETAFRRVMENGIYSDYYDL